MTINLPEKVNILINYLESCGFEAFAVGGCIRDSIMGRTPNDWDLCTNATPEEMKACFGGPAGDIQAGGGPAGAGAIGPAGECADAHSGRMAESCCGPAAQSQSEGPWRAADPIQSEKPWRAAIAGCHVIETGLKHGTLTVLLDGEAFEITTYRIDGEYSDGRHPDAVTFTRSLREDLARRDFTVNAMAYNDASGLVDPFGGQADIEACCLRCVGDPVLRFTEDSLRILRGMRFASQLGFVIDAKTAAGMRECMPLLGRVAAERIRVELDKLLCGSAAPDVLREYRDIIAHVIPEIRPMFDLDQKNSYHIYDVWEHTLHVVSHIPPDPVLRLSAFFHDIGKPSTMTVVPNDKALHPDASDEWGHFYGHEPAGAEITNEVMRRLKYDNATRETVCAVIDAHKIVFQPKPRHARRLLLKLGEERLRILIQLELADVKSQNPVYSDERVENINTFTAILDEVLAAEQCFSLKHLAVGGRDLIDLGVPQGREIGRILNALLDQVVEGNLANDREVLLQRAAELI